MTQGRVENSRVHFWTFSPVSVKCHLYDLKDVKIDAQLLWHWEKISNNRVAIVLKILSKDYREETELNSLGYLRLKKFFKYRFINV